MSRKLKIDEDHFAMHVTGWVVGISRNLKSMVVYLYSDGPNHPIPCYEERFSDLPSQIEIPEKPMIYGAVPTLDVCIALDILKPCDFDAIFEYYGYANEKGFRRARYAGVFENVS